MRIHSFNVLAETYTEIYTLKDCPVVIDAFNYFYNLYEKSGLPFAFGCNCDKFADYARESLVRFQEANVTCYFVFKGGISDMQKNINKKAKNPKTTREYHPNKGYYFEPLFTQEVYMQVLKEMNMKFSVCKTEAKSHCIALARDLNCPIISYDIEYCFANVLYIPLNTLSQNQSEGRTGIECRLFRFNKFLESTSLTKEKLVLFILLRNEELYPKDTFHGFFRSLNIPNSSFTRNQRLLNWLSEMPSKEHIEKMVLKYLNNNERKIRSHVSETFSEMERRAQSYVDPRIDLTIPAKYLKDDKVEAKTEEEWFELAVASGRIPAQYINLWRDNFMKYKATIQGLDSRNAVFAALDVIKYVYVLLTNKQNTEFTIYNNDGDLDDIKVNRCVQGKVLQGKVLDKTLLLNNFENVSVKEFFLKVPSYNIFRYEKFDAVLKRVTEDNKLLYIALAWCYAKSEYFTIPELFSVLLCHFMLSSASETSEDIVMSTPNGQITIPSMDIVAAMAVLLNFFEVTDADLAEIFDRKILHPLVEFQHLLQHLNLLNTLCGEPFKPTNYSMTFNATFVYNILYKIKKQHNNNYKEFIDSCLKCSVGVHTYLLNWIEFWENDKERYCAPVLKSSFYSFF